ASLADWLALARAYEAAALAADVATPIPLIWGTDAVHGHNNLVGATIFPHNIGLGAAADEALVQAIGTATARAIRASGIGWAFAPTLAVVQDARWGRTYESFSDDPALVARLGAAAVRGLQGTLGADDSVLACAKHYIGDGGTDGGRDQGINRASADQLAAVHGAGYVSALAAGVQTVMASFNSWQQTDAAGSLVHDHGKLHGSHFLLTEVLKQHWGFDGLVVSDWNGVGQVTGCSNSRCAAALNAGIDMVMVPELWREFIADTIALVDAGEVPMARIDDAVRRILRVKLRAGLFEQASSQGRWAGRADALAARALARRAVRQSLVLLKNNAGVLPLARPQAGQRLLVVGKSADSLQNQTGGWTLTWQGTGNANRDFPNGDSVLAGLRQALGEHRVAFSETAEGVDLADVDAVIAVLGETPYAEGAGDIPPPGTLHHSSHHPEDLAVLQRVAGRGVPVVTLLLTGRPLLCNDLINRSDAVVVGWLPGSEGAGVADLLLRDPAGRVAHDYSGRLPFAWPTTVEAQEAGPATTQPPFPRGFGLRCGDTTPLGLLDERRPAVTDAAPTELVLFDRVAQPGASLRVGSLDGHWHEADLGDDLNAVIALPAAEPAIQVSTVQLHTQQDARQVRWVGPARLLIACNPQARLDALAHAALVFDLQLTQAPQAAVTLAMVSEGGNTGALDLTPLLHRLPLHQVRTLKLPLALFAAQGVDLSRVLTPFSLATTGALTLSLARIRIVADAARDADALTGADLPPVPR
ncbi:MAG: glycoside hydrolase family 3 N-terminal domain-containing protein, partial [Aquabacterium sp.]|nr:glycoside hydrolase family 3 N-terminal domain-containing protein [Aquabacterium sp.]